MPTEPPRCRCNGTGAYTAEVSLADAVVLIRRVCLKHLGRRARVKDPTTGRTGEVMEVVGARAYLRPAEGGKEWTAEASSLEPAQDTP